MMKKKGILLAGVLIFTFIFLINFAEAQQATTYCAEKTVVNSDGTGGAWCQNVPESECQTGTNPVTGQPYRCERTACESTSYCSTGTCENTKAGECLPSSQAACNPSEGGIFYDEEKEDVSRCQVGCCILGESASLVERTKCDFQARDYNVKPDFRETVQDELSCAALAFPKEKGACVVETDEGRQCTHITREECTGSAGEFHGGFLCTNPQLGTRCVMSENTKCEGTNVYFEDSCGNTANVYDARKKDDTQYWSYFEGVQGVEVSLGDGKGNKVAPYVRDYGLCSILDGSICAEYDRTVDGITNSPKYGDYICRNMDCKAGPFVDDFKKLNGGKAPQHGEEWCSGPISDFEDPEVGDLSYLLYCFNGKVQYEPCDLSRNFLCSQNQTTNEAECLPNRWQQCIFQESEEDCLSSDRDCEIVPSLGRGSVGTLPTTYGTKKTFDYGEPIKVEDLLGPVGGLVGKIEIQPQGSCVPKYPPALQFWDPKGTLAEIEGEETIGSYCALGGTGCYVPYYTEFSILWDFDVDMEKFGGCIDECKREEAWSEEKCTDACTPRCLPIETESGDKDDPIPIEEAWAQNYQNLCTSLGDCGISANYKGYEGRNSWKDLFKGDKVDFGKLPNAEAKK